MFNTEPCTTTDSDLMKTRSHIRNMPPSLGKASLMSSRNLWSTFAHINSAVGLPFLSSWDIDAWLPTLPQHFRQALEHLAPSYSELVEDARLDALHYNTAHHFKTTLTLSNPNTRLSLSCVETPGQMYLTVEVTDNYVTLYSADEPSDSVIFGLAYHVEHAVAAYIDALEESK